MYRTIQEEKVKKRAAENNEENEEEKRPKQQFDKDFTLEPFEGVSPEYMEMSESLFNSLSHSLLQSHKIYVFYLIMCPCLHVCFDIYSNPVRVCVSVRRLLPAGAGIRPAEQRH